MPDTPPVAPARPLGDPLGRFAAANTLDEYAYANSAMLGFLIGQIADGAPLTTAAGRARLVDLADAIDHERSAALNRILDGDAA